MHLFLFSFLLLLSQKTYACPFCELGSSDTAFFIVTIFGLFILSMLSLLLYQWKTGGLNYHSELSGKALEAENIKPNKESSDEPQ